MEHNTMTIHSIHEIFMYLFNKFKYIFHFREMKYPAVSFKMFYKKVILSIYKNQNRYPNQVYNLMQTCFQYEKKNFESFAINRANIQHLKSLKHVSLHKSLPN
ncbi:hypothetical protein HHI36_022780 [Cryptolaemus montrouzieri]|uniref:Uncharacterized protein n=1 Tax=Cryptolaemus montrouzieri TaxID=559131 RepID=A0ABD2PEE0_9CUCU